LICLLQSLGASQVLLIKPNPLGYQITVSISRSLSLQTQAAHDVGHWVVLFALKTSVVRTDPCGGRQEHRSLGAGRVPNFEGIAGANTDDALNLFLLTLRNRYKMGF